MTAPLWSRTAPRITPVSNWAEHGSPTRSKTNEAKTERRSMLSGSFIHVQVSFPNSSKFETTIAIRWTGLVSTDSLLFQERKSGKYLGHNISANSGNSLLEAEVEVSKLRMVESHQMQDGRVKIGNMNRLFDGLE